MKHLFLFSFLFFFGIITAQQTDTVDFERIKADLTIEEGKVSGFVLVKLRTLRDTDSIYLDAIKMTFEKVELRNLTDDRAELTEYDSERDKIVLRADFHKDVVYELQFSYAAEPKKAMYFVDDQIWTQGQGKYTSNWLPSIDDMNDKIEFDLSITYDTGYEVLANGALVKKESLPQNQTKWHYDMQAPMSSYLVALAIGKYSKKTETSLSGIPLEYYYYPKDSAKVEPTYRFSKQMFDFLEEEIIQKKRDSKKEN